MIITILRKPLEGSVAENTLKHGCGALNIDESRIETDEESFFKEWERNQSGSQGVATFTGENQIDLNNYVPANGRWPANFILMGDNSVISLDVQSGNRPSTGNYPSNAQSQSLYRPNQGSYQKQGTLYSDGGGASRFFKQFKKEEPNEP